MKERKNCKRNKRQKQKKKWNCFLQLAVLCREVLCPFKKRGQREAGSS